MLTSAGFLAAHPDLQWRNEGVRAWREGDRARALELFLRAAHYGDKASQAMVAEMYWLGEGVGRDRPRAYAWMDLAAERMYRRFLVRREQYWAELDEAERERALAVGEDIYADYGDAVAKPRLERVLARARRTVTGTRTGFVGTLQVQVVGPGGTPIVIDGARFYDPQYWEPERYWAWQDDVWQAPPKGRVTVGELERIAGPDGRPSD
ncbi:tetratricopeptide repeat protein [Coralloluteibacterium stylophorae]|uniref:Sel1 repeat family protein n=1 Tax=Coralloluteibacterium stylophorae TaxID=1776034 RepID=A0A8J7VST2_9GAMM|nr:sel1 repeat family protein [Coralloluteibacterium stylophorae]MBS7457102.1 sel1 repeat family protein [Coralloluteibacterium stylophorae]